METHITQVNEKLQLILTSGVINSLTQHVQQNMLADTSTPQRPLSFSTVDNLDAQLNAVPSVPSTNNTEMLSQSTVAQDINPEVLQQDDVLVEGNEVEITNASVEIANTSVEGNEVEITNASVEIADTSIESAGEPGLLTPADVVPIYVRSCSRRNFAVLLIRRLIDKEVRRRSNVTGKGKERLDPDVVQYVKTKCFEYYPCQAADIKKEWSLCIISIDESCRRLNKATKNSHGTAN